LLKGQNGENYSGFFEGVSISFFELLDGRRCDLFAKAGFKAFVSLAVA
jgi:hypothetical protein